MRGLGNLLDHVPLVQLTSCFDVTFFSQSLINHLADIFLFFVLHSLKDGSKLLLRVLPLPGLEVDQSVLDVLSTGQQLLEPIVHVSLLQLREYLIESERSGLSCSRLAIVELFLDKELRDTPRVELLGYEIACLWFESQWRV